MDPALRRALWRLLYAKRPPGERVIASLLRNRRSSSLRDALQDVFSEYARRLARLAAEGKTTQFAERAERAIRNALVAQRAFAVRRAPLPSELLEMALGPLEFQLGKLAAFVAEVKATSVANRSEPAIGARMELYSGAGRAEWFRGEEEDAGEGDVVDYVALDDDATCHPCLMAEQEGPYLPGEGPFPGEVCLGRGHCRCRRIIRHDPRGRRALAA